MKPRWNGEPCEARQVRVIVADAPEFPLYWARRFVGQERAAVEVTQNGHTFYLDDEGYEQTDEALEYLTSMYEAASPEIRDHLTEPKRTVGYPGWGWAKVMAGGSPRHGSASLTIERVVG